MENELNDTRPVANDVIAAAAILEARIADASRADLDVIIGTLHHLQLGLNALEACGFDHVEAMTALRSANAAFDARRSAIRAGQHAIISAREIRDAVAPGSLGIVPVPKGTDVVTAVRRLESWIGYVIHERGKAVRVVTGALHAVIGIDDVRLADDDVVLGTIRIPTARIVGIGDDRHGTRFMLEDGSIVYVEIDLEPIASAA